MRCKNCGSENDEKLYICQNCGSPLYDEEEPAGNGADGTQVFGAVSTPEDDQDADDYAAQRAAARRQRAEEQRKRKQQITIIVVLSVVLLAIIVGTVIAIVHGKNKATDETTNTSISTSVSETSSQKSSTTKPTESSTAESTTTTTTTSTTEKKTTEASSYTVSVSYDYGGTVSGGGSYKNGETATVRATADTGYTFDGWYDGNKKVSSDAVYTFQVKSNTSLKARFAFAEVQPGGDEPGMHADTDEGEFN